MVVSGLGVRQRTFALRARWRCAYPSVTAVARTVVRLAPLWRWCAYPSTATGVRCGAGLAASVATCMGEWWPGAPIFSWGVDLCRGTERASSERVCNVSLETVRGDMGA